MLAIRKARCRSGNCIVEASPPRNSEVKITNSVVLDRPPWLRDVGVFESLCARRARRQIGQMPNRRYQPIHHPDRGGGFAIRRLERLVWEPGTTGHWWQRGQCKQSGRDGRYPGIGGRSARPLWLLSGPLSQGASRPKMRYDVCGSSDRSVRLPPTDRILVWDRHQRVGPKPAPRPSIRAPL